MLVEPLEPANKSAGGIMLAENYLQPSNQGRVVAAGPACVDVQAGDRVIYSWINTIEVEHEGKKLRLLHMDNLLGVIS